jgi:hypothetical protein
MASIFGCIVLAVVSTCIFIISSGGIILNVFDPMAIIIMILVPFLFQCIFHGKFFINAFTIICKKEEQMDTWVKAYNFFKNYEQFTWLIAILFLLIRFIILLIWLENRDGLGPNIKFMANIIIGAALLDLLIILPYKIVIKKHLTQIG